MEVRSRWAHLLEIIAVNFSAFPIMETVMPVILRLLKALSRAIAEAKMQRVERELLLHGIPYWPLRRPPQD
jgi:hypothetical protein